MPFWPWGGQAPEATKDPAPASALTKSGQRRLSEQFDETPSVSFQKPHRRMSEQQEAELKEEAKAINALLASGGKPTVKKAKPVKIDEQAIRQREREERRRHEEAQKINNLLKASKSDKQILGDRHKALQAGKADMAEIDADELLRKREAKRQRQLERERKAAEKERQRESERQRALKRGVTAPASIAELGAGHDWPQIADDATPSSEVTVEALGRAEAAAKLAGGIFLSRQQYAGFKDVERRVRSENVALKERVADLEQTVEAMNAVQGVRRDDSPNTMSFFKRRSLRRAASFHPSTSTSDMDGWDADDDGPTKSSPSRAMTRSRFSFGRRRPATDDDGEASSEGASPGNSRNSLRKFAGDVGRSFTRRSPTRNSSRKEDSSPGTSPSPSRPKLLRSMSSGVLRNSSAPPSRSGTGSASATGASTHNDASTNEASKRSSFWKSKRASAAQSQRNVLSEAATQQLPPPTVV